MIRPHSEGKDKRNMLSYAAEIGKLKVIKVLLEWGDVSAHQED